MKFLLRGKSKKSGYCNISEPVSDLDPARISAIKARHSKLSESPTTPIPKQQRSNSSSNDNDDTLVTENITLDTSPSAVTSSQASSSKSPSATSKKKVLPNLQEASKPETEEAQTASLSFPLNASSEFGDANNNNNNDAVERSTGRESQSTSSPQRQLAPKTPDTFFGGKNRKRIPIKMDSTSQAPTEHPIAALRVGYGGKEEQDADIVHVPQSTKVPNNHLEAGRSSPSEMDNQSQSSDLDKSFSPQIVSVISDITDPSFGMTRRNKESQQQPSWKKLKRLRRYLHETMKTNNGTCSSGGKKNQQQQQQNTLSFFESVIDAICTYPSSEAKTGS